MITSESATEELAMVSRMLSYQLQQEESAEKAFIALRKELPSKYERSIKALEGMVSSNGRVSLVGYGNSSFGLLNNFIEIIRSEGKDVSQLLACSQGVMRDAIGQAREYWSGFNALISYFVTVLIIAMTISSIFKIFVLPQFQSMFDSFGAGLPVFTKFMLDDEVFFPLVISMLTMAVLLCVACAYHIKLRVVQFRPLSKIFSKIPGVNTLSNIYNYYLFIQYTTMLCKSGVSENSAIEHAKRYANISDTDAEGFMHLQVAVRTALKMGALMSELEYQSAQVGATFGRYMILVRERLTLVVQVVLGVLIGALIIAMYLPIFKMGEVV